MNIKVNLFLMNRHIYILYPKYNYKVMNTSIQVCLSHAEWRKIHRFLPIKQKEDHLSKILLGQYSNANGFNIIH